MRLRRKRRRKAAKAKTSWMKAVKGENAVDENGEKVEAEIVTEEADGEETDDAADDGEEEKKEKIIYYVTDLVQQSQYVNMFKNAGMDAVVLPDKIDQPFVSQLESKE